MRGLTIDRKSWLLYIGRDEYRCLDVNISFHWKPVADPQMYRLRFQHGVSVSWDWRPRVHWLDECWGWDGGSVIPAVRWTGRRWRLQGWSWPFAAFAF